MIVHPGAGAHSHTLVNALLFHFPGIIGVGSETRPGIVHRLDKETSGLLVVARTPKAYQHLQKQFKDRSVMKTYYGLVWGKMPEGTGTIDWPLGRHVKHGTRISVKTKKPKSAITHYRVERRFEDHTLLILEPLTGRTHQIRVHLAASGHPVVGDLRYGRRKGKKPAVRLFLHAHELGFTHPGTGKQVTFQAALPADLKSFLDSL
jgi:23S rRNA pseudouridine1911/1915/1917 synthase